MTTTIATIMTDVTSVVGAVIALSDVAIYAAFGFVVTAGVLLVRRTSKALR